MQVLKAKGYIGMIIKDKIFLMMSRTTLARMFRRTIAVVLVQYAKHLIHLISWSLKTNKQTEVIFYGRGYLPWHLKTTLVYTKKLTFVFLLLLYCSTQLRMPAPMDIWERGISEWNLHFIKKGWNVVFVSLSVTANSHFGRIHLHKAYEVRWDFLKFLD